MPLEAVKSQSAKNWWALAGVSLASFLGCADFTIVNTAMPAIQDGFMVGLKESQWVISAFLMALSATMVIMGRLADRNGRRRGLYLSMALFGGASIAAAVAPSLAWLVFFRALQGVACAGLYTASTAIVSNAFSDTHRGKALGILFGVNGMGLAVGPVLGDVLVELYGWRSIFLLNVPVVIISFVICFFSVRESKAGGDAQRMDWLGAVVLAAIVSMLIFLIVYAGSWGWMSEKTLLGVALVAVLSVLMVKIETRHTWPILPFHLFKVPGFIVATASSCVLAVFYCTALFFMPLYLKIVAGYGAGVVGLMLLPTTAVMAVASPLVGRWVDRKGPWIAIKTGCLLLAASAAIQWFFDINTAVFLIILAFTAMGIGWACILGPSTVAALSSVDEAEGASAAGASWTLHNVTGAVGLAIGTSVYQLFVKNWFENAQLAAQGIEEWKLAADPAGASQALQNAGISGAHAIELSQQMFVAGYSHVMLLLLVISVVGFLALALTTKHRIFA